MTNHNFEIAGTLAVSDVPDVRRFIERLHRRVVENVDDMSRVLMAAHELLENAIKFSSDNTATLQIAVSSGTDVRITTRNRARAKDLEDLGRIAQELGSCDPMMFYLGRMYSAPMAQGGLGLGRVAAEGEMQMSLEVQGDTVEVNALLTLSRRP